MRGEGQVHTSERRSACHCRAVKQHIPPKLKGTVLEGTSLDSQNSLLSQRPIEKIGF